MALFTNNNRPQVSIEGDTPPIHYLPWRFAKAGDIVFNTLPTPGDDSSKKLGYIGYMCVQDGIPEIENDYVKFGNDIADEATYQKPLMAQEAKWKCFGKILVICFFFLFAQLTQAQGWAKLYGSEQDRESGGLMLLNNNGNILMRTYIDRYDLFGNPVGYGNSLWVFNTEGDTLYTKLKGNTVSILPTTDGNYLLGGSYQFGSICKVNALIDTIWTYSSITEYAIERADGSFTTIGTTFATNNEPVCSVPVSTPISISLSADGVLLNTSIWFNYADSNIVGPNCSFLYTNVTDILDIGNDRFIISAFADNPENVFEDMNLVAVFEGSNLDNAIWKNTSVHGGAYKLLLSPDGNYLAIGYVHSEQNSSPTGSRITKYSTIGDTLWSKIINDTLILSRSVLAIGENKHLAMMNYNGNAYLSMLDENWNIIWQKAYDFPNQIGLGGLLAAPNGGYYISGRYYPYTNNKSDIILLKTDSLGNCTPKANFGLVQQDSLLTLTNTSFGADSYQWLWGNGAGLQDTVKQSTQYIYPQTGIYHVCLVAHNLCGNDTLCQTINYGVADGLHNALPTTPFSIANNPISAPTIQLIHPPLPTAATATVCNLNGQILLQQTLSVAQANSHINIALLPAGIYLLQIKGQNIWWQQKVVVVK